MHSRRAADSRPGAAAAPRMPNQRDAMCTLPQHAGLGDSSYIGEHSRAHELLPRRRCLECSDVDHLQLRIRDAHLREAGPTALNRASPRCASSCTPDHLPPAALRTKSVGIMPMQGRYLCLRAVFAQQVRRQERDGGLVWEVLPARSPALHPTQATRASLPGRRRNRPARKQAHACAQLAAR